MDFFQAIILGLVEGFTEFLPISSTGHLVLAGRLLGLAQSDFLKFFEVFVQAGAVMAVVVLYWEIFLKNWLIWKKIMLAFLPSAILGFLFYKIIKRFLGDFSVILWALALGGLFLIIFEILYAKKRKNQPLATDISYKQALSIGFCQCLAMIPGVSRSAATILGGLYLGIERKIIVEFSFLLAAPTIIAASIFDFYKTIIDWSGNNMSIQDLWSLALGFMVSFVVALLAVKFLIRYIQRHSFISFGVYRIVVAVLFYFLVIRLAS
jgi:undecaprenyl-diphosphatase